MREKGNILLLFLFLAHGCSIPQKAGESLGVKAIIYPVSEYTNEHGEITNLTIWADDFETKEQFVEYLKKIGDGKAMKKIKIIGKNFTDEHVKYITSKSLEQGNFFETAITEKGYQNLKERLPKFVCQPGGSKKIEKEVPKMGETGINLGPFEMEIVADHFFANGDFCLAAEKYKSVITNAGFKDVLYENLPPPFQKVFQKCRGAEEALKVSGKTIKNSKP